MGLPRPDGRRSVGRPGLSIIDKYLTSRQAISTTVDLSKVFTPRPWQARVLQSKARFQVIAGGRRIGKTKLLLYRLLLEGLKAPRRRIWYVGPTYRAAKMIAWKELCWMVPRELLNHAPYEHELRLELINGTEFALKGADEPDSLRGPGLHAIGMDEEAYARPNVFEEILRPTLSDTKGWAMFGSTPHGRNHFFRRYMLGQEGNGEWQSWRVPSSEVLDEKELADAKSLLSDVVYNQEYNAQFLDSGGSVYEVREAIHLVDPFVMPDDAPRIVGIDPGLRASTGVVFAAVLGQDVYVFDEWKQPNVLVPDVAEMIRSRMGSTWRNARYYIDPSSKIRNFVTGGTVQEAYRAHEIPVQVADHAMAAGIASVQNLLRVNPITGHPRLFIMKTCEKLWAELVGYSWRAMDRGMMTERPDPACEDHLLDALRYLVMARPVDPNPIAYDLMDGLQPEIYWSGDRPRENEWPVAGGFTVT